MSAPIAVDYDPEWPGLFRQLEALVLAIVGDDVVRLDHIGSTSVPGLAAKDVIDLQVSVPSLAVSRQRGVTWQNSPMATLEVLDQGERISISFGDLLKYHGRSSIAGVAHAFKVMERALPLLSPGQPPERREITVDSGFPGDGARDAFEMVTRAVTDDRFRVTPELAGPDVPEAPGGYFFFRLGYEGTVVDLALRDGLVPEDFLRFVCREAPTDADAARAKQLKEEMADRLLGLPPDEVYDAKVVT